MIYIDESLNFKYYFHGNNFFIETDNVKSRVKSTPTSPTANDVNKSKLASILLVLIYPYKSISTFPGNLQLLYSSLS